MLPVRAHTLSWGVDRHTSCRCPTRRCACADPGKRCEGHGFEFSRVSRCGLRPFAVRAEETLGCSAYVSRSCVCVLQPPPCTWRGSAAPPPPPTGRTVFASFDLNLAPKAPSPIFPPVLRCQFGGNGPHDVQSKEEGGSEGRRTTSPLHRTCPMPWSGDPAWCPRGLSCKGATGGESPGRSHPGVQSSPSASSEMGVPPCMPSGLARGPVVVPQREVHCVCHRFWF